MELNLIGIAAALATFLGVWMGHVTVRKVERETVDLRTPTRIMLALGIGFGVFSILTPSLILSAMSGIFAMTLVWDSHEFIRQQERIRIGRAPANPNNSRHAKILAEHPTATTVDWLEREPRGDLYSAVDLMAFKEGVE